jgi:2-keto-4-pentenoate hydratase
MLKGLPEHCRPRSMADGYAIQNAFRAMWTEPVAGWKIGATAEAIMQRYGLDEPMMGPVYAPDVFTSPARPAPGRFNHFCIETEFAYRFQRALPPRDNAYARAEILDAVECLIPAFELINPRYERIPFDSAAEAVADCTVNGGMVLGAPILEWRGLDLLNHRVRLVVDGEVKGEGTGADALGDPVNVLEWTINRLSKDGVGLDAGQLISTGTMTGVVHVEAGQTAIGDFGSLGQVEIRYAAPVRR